MLKISGLTKQYGKLTAVNDLNLSIETGDIMGFIGPNGAGKTTTIKIAATLLSPTAGTVSINGLDVLNDREAVRPLIGYMPDFFGMYEDAKVWEYLDFFASAYHVPPKMRKGTISDVLELTDLSHKRDNLVSELSRGMQQRLCLAKTLLHDPALLLLDEPASGLDPRARIEIKELLKELQKMGKTILISSHILPELADFCNKIAVIEQGKLVISGDVHDIIETVRAGIGFAVRVADRMEETVKFLQTIPDISEAHVEDGFIKVIYRGEPEQDYKILAALINNGFKVKAFDRMQVDLEDVFLKVTRGIVS